MRLKLEGKREGMSVMNFNFICDIVVSGFILFYVTYSVLLSSEHKSSSKMLDQEIKESKVFCLRAIRFLAEKNNLTYDFHEFMQDEEKSTEEMKEMVEKLRKERQNFTSKYQE
jgi:hypothetical protein